jgi:hypothetical protein
MYELFLQITPIFRGQLYTVNVISTGHIDLYHSCCQDRCHDVDQACE